MTVAPDEQFSALQPRLVRLHEEVRFALDHRLTGAGVKTHSITGRVKSKESFLEKVDRKNYSDPIQQVDDLVGVRVVCLFLSDLPRVGEVIKSAFEVLEEIDRVDGGEASDSFGYMSVHYVCRLSSQSFGPRYDDLVGLRFELQVRTIVMDAWANISHHLAYKGEASVPGQLRRDFHALAGLFYVADQHFELFFRESAGNREAAEGAVAEAQGAAERDSPIDRDTLMAVLKNMYPDREQPTQLAASEFVEELHAVGYDTVRVLTRDLKRARRAALAYEAKNPPGGMFDEQPRRFAALGIARQAVGIMSFKYSEMRFPEADFMFEEFRRLVD